MNKLLTLYDIEFKRVKKIYFSILALLTLCNFAYFFFKIFSLVKEVEKGLRLKGELSLLKRSDAVRIMKEGFSIESIYNVTYFIMTLAIIWCLYYSLTIWYKDFSNKTKVAYTLFMLPYNKFNVYLSKLITVVSLFYGILVTQHFFWWIEMFIIKILTNIPMTEIIERINYNNSISFILSTVSIYPMELFIFYIIGPIFAVTILFTGVLIHKSMKKIGGFLGVVYVLSMFFTYLSCCLIYVMFTDELLVSNLLYFLVSILLSMFISYKLINNSICV